jgi:hypothetical protein
MAVLRYWNGAQSDRLPARCVKTDSLGESESALHASWLPPQAGAGKAAL